MEVFLESPTRRPVQKQGCRVFKRGKSEVKSKKADSERLEELQSGFQNIPQSSAFGDQC